MRVLITGGAGFVGANLAIGLAARHEGWQITSLDNLRRRGSELNLGRLRTAGVRFVHGDVREPGDLAGAGRFDALVECSAEPSVTAGLAGDLDYVVGTNLVGAYHCLEVCRRQGAHFVFLSTSRVYPLGPLCEIDLEEGATRFMIASKQRLRGVSRFGISESFALNGARTFYGTTKLCAEHLASEFAYAFSLPVTINRFGVIAGPWQMGRVDQGVVTYWVTAHLTGRPLTYLGYGGSGKQVRDVLHVADVVDLIDLQLQEPDAWAGTTQNVGGGPERSLSLVELTAMCREATGRTTRVRGSAEGRIGDVPLYITDSRALFKRTQWRPRLGVPQIIEDVSNWARSADNGIANVFGRL